MKCRPIRNFQFGAVHCFIISNAHTLVFPSAENALRPLESIPDCACVTKNPISKRGSGCQFYDIREFRKEIQEIIKIEVVKRLVKLRGKCLKPN